MQWKELTQSRTHNLFEGSAGRMERKRREVGVLNVTRLVPKFTGSRVPAILMHFHVESGQLFRLSAYLAKLGIK